MTTAGSIAVGNRWERRALRHLERHGLESIDRNFRCRMGEIDLVMQDGDCLVFVEVRYRKGGRFASAASSIDRYKQRRLATAASLFLARNARFRDYRVRFDVVAFDRTSDSQCTLQWLKDAFRPEH